MVPRGTIPRRAAANCRLTRPISSMADAVPSPVSAAACSGVISVRLELLAATTQSKRLAEAPFATTATVGVLRMQSPDNSRVSCSIGTCIDTNRALGHRARSVGTQAHSGAKRRALPQTEVADERDAATHRVQRRPNRPPPILDICRHPDTQMRWPRAGARRCTRPCPVRSDRMWSLPISPAAADILLINSLRRVNGSVDSWSACWSGVYCAIRDIAESLTDTSLI